ncbi:MAG: dephospho-CoA kinase, partial [Eubacteriales bacterium]|nr:dephospho-CoA kinase [Eubacteriales bacterium]
LKSAFGEDIYLPDGSLNKEKYKKLIFESDKNRELSNHIVHPIVWKWVLTQIGQDASVTPDEDEKYVIETALPSKEFTSMCDEIWCVVTDEEIRIERLMSSRGYTEEYARSVLEKQASDNDYTVISDYVIYNNGGMDSLKDKIDMRIKTFK